MSKTPPEIAEHELLRDEFFLLEKIEDMEKEAFEQLHRHDFYEILWFTEVNPQHAWHQIDLKTYPILPHQVYVLSPNQIHYMPTLGKKGYLMAFPKSLFSSLDFPLFSLIQPYFHLQQLDKETKNSLAVLIKLMQKEYQGLKRKSLLYTYCNAFLIHISLKSGENHRDFSDRLIRLLQHIETNYAYEKEIKFYAQQLRLSERRLNEICVEHTGKTVKQFITDRRLTEAKRLIMLNQLSIKEIAYRIGYNDPAYFSRIFKKKTSFTPAAFRAHQDSFN